jgi:hypothetical protein
MPQTLTELRTVQITSGASPVNVPLPSDSVWDTLLAEVTSGNTASAEVVNLPNLAVDVNGFDQASTGRKVLVFTKTQLDPADSVRVHVAGSPSVLIVDSTAMLRGNLSNGVLIDFPGAVAEFRWNGQVWRYHNDSPNDASIENMRAPLPPGGTTGQVPVKNSWIDGDASWGGGFTGGKTVGAETWTFVEGRLSAIA